MKSIIMLELDPDIRSPGRSFKLNMPQGDIIYVAAYDGGPKMWVAAELDKPIVDREFWLVTTGTKVPNEFKSVGSFETKGEWNTIFHLFEDKGGPIERKD